MRCEDVIRELAAPGDGLDAAALADHLDNCSACAEWSARMASWDRLWNSTRPVEPAPDVWDAMWGRLERSLDRSPAGAREPVGSGILTQSPHAPLRIAPTSGVAENRPALRSVEVQRGTVSQDSIPFWNGSRREYLRIAAAAVILMMVGLFTFNSPSRRDGPVVAQVSIPGGPVAPSIDPPSIDTVNIDEGQLVVIRSADPRVGDEASVVVINRYEPDAMIDPFNGVVIDPWYVMFNMVESMTNPVVASLDLPGR
jgi:hypothetical protein